MTRQRWLLVGAGGVVAAWLVTLLVLDVAGADRVARGIAGRLGDSLQGEAHFGDSDLALVRGKLDLEQLAVRRDDAVGRLALDIADIHCELAPLGGALFDRDCDPLAIRGMRMEVSTIALFKLRPPKRRPIHADSVVIDDATFVFAAGAIGAGIGEVRVTLDRAIAGPTTFKTPLSWLFALRGLRAHVSLPGQLAIDVTFAHGVLQASGSLLGQPPLAIAVTLPETTDADDGRAQLAKLTSFGRELVQQLLARRAEVWLRKTLLGQPR